MSVINVYVGLLQRNANYRNLWLARVVSNLGDWFNLLASATLITQLTGAGTAISLLFLVRFLPLFLMSPFAGVLADRFDRRQILIATNLLRTVTVLCFLFVNSPDRVWLLYVLTALQFVFSAVFTPAETAFVPAIVTKDDLVTANALDSLTWSSMLALGAMLGGLATATLGVQAAFILDALSFLVSAWFITRIHPAVSSMPPAHHKRSVSDGLFAFVEGLQFLVGRRTLLVIALAKAGGALIWGSVNVLEVPLAQNIFPVYNNGTLTLGLLYAAIGIGTGFGPLILRARLGDTYPGMLTAITVGYGAMTLGTLGLALAPNLAAVLVVTLVRGFGTGAIWVFATVLLQLLAPDAFRGRVFAFEFAALTLAQSISTLWAGYAYDTLGLSVSQILLMMGSLSLFVTIAIGSTFTAFRRRRLSGP